MKQIVFFLCFTGLLFSFCYGQMPDLDSLEQVFKAKKLPLKEEIQLCDDLSWEYLSIDFQKSSFYARAGIELAHQAKDDFMIGILYRNLGVAYHMKNKFDSAFACFDEAMEYARKTNDKGLEMRVLVARANSYNSQGNYSEALKYYTEGLVYYEKANKKENLLKLYGNIAAIYRMLRNHEQAGKYFEKSIPIAEELGDYSALGTIYQELSVLGCDKGEYDKALNYARQALAAARKAGDNLVECSALQALAMCYYSGYKNYPKAETHALEAVEIANQTGFPRYVSGSYCMLSNVYLNWKKYDKCEEFALKAYAADSLDGYFLSNIIGNLIITSIKSGHDEKGVEYLSQYRGILEKYATKEYQSSLSEMEVKYETQTKELKILALEKEKKLIFWLIASGIAVFVLIASLIFFRLRNKRRLAEQKVIQLEKEKQLVATQAVLDGETAERVRLARDLHDGLGSMLSVAKLGLQDLKSVSIEEEDSKRFEKVMATLDTSMRELRRVAHNLMPQSLARNGLKTALTDFCSNIPTSKFHYYGKDERLDQNLEVTIYRTVHELANNAIKHAAASQIDIQFVQGDDQLSLSVSDNGAGFDMSKTKQGMGLQNIQDRIRSYNGRMDIFSEPGKGTEIQVAFPVRKG